jgi:hypothetical protein
MIISLNSINQLIFVMVESCVFSEVQAEFLNIIYVSFGFNGLIETLHKVVSLTEIDSIWWARDSCGLLRLMPGG